MRTFFALLCGAVLISGCSSDTSDTSGNTATGFDSTFLDRSADPCTDFFQFSCGSWLAQHPASPGRGVERFAIGDEREQIYFTRLIEAMSSSDASLQPAQSYFQACRAAHQGLTQTLGGIQKQLTAISQMTSVADLPGVLASLHTLGTSALFHADVNIDPHAPTAYVVTLRDGGWSLPSRASYDDTDLANAYRTHMATLTGLVASQTVPVRIDESAAFDFERSIAQAGVDNLDPAAGNQAISTDKLAAAVPDFDWSGYFSGRTFAAVSNLDLLQPSFPTALEQLLGATPLATLQGYLAWRVLEADAYSSNSPLIDEELHFHRGIVDGEATPPSADYLCLVATRDAFGFDLARHFVQAFVASDLKPAAVDFVTQIRDAMQKNLDQVAWLDDATRARAQDKLALLLANVAYPDTWPAPASSLGPSSTFFLTMVQARAEAGAAAAAARLTQPVNRDEFWASPEINNAFYSDERNDITIPVAVLESPFYAQNRGAAFNYGALGGVVGHELSHAFDNNGRQFDGTGLLTDWWTDSVATEFEARSQCLVDQFDGYEALPGIHVDGQQTLPENIADLGGLKLAWAAFESLAEKGGSADSFSPEQQFFLSFAQLQCASLSDEALTLQLANDPHSPPKYRVNGVVRNLPQFAAAFSCPTSAALGSADRCEVW